MKKHAKKRITLEEFQRQTGILNGEPQKKVKEVHVFSPKAGGIKTKILGMDGGQPEEEE